MAAALGSDTLAWPLVRAISITVDSSVVADITVHRSTDEKAATLFYAFQPGRSNLVPVLSHSFVDGAARFSFATPREGFRLELGSTRRHRPTLQLVLSLPDSVATGLDLVIDAKVHLGQLEISPLVGQLGNVSVSFTHANPTTGIVIMTDSSALIVRQLAAQSLRLASDWMDIVIGQITVAGPAQILTTSGDIKMDAVSASSQLEIHSDTGNISASSLSSGDVLGVRSSSGTVKVSSVQAASFNVAADAGDAKFEQIRAISAVLSSSSGNIKAGTLETQMLLDVKAITGSIRLDCVGAAAAHFSTHSTNIDINTLIASGTVTARAVGGDISIRDMSVHSVDLESNSGNVKIRAGVINKARAVSSSGNVKVELNFVGSDPAAECLAILGASSGDVKSSVVGYMQLDSRTDSGDNKLDVNPLPGSQTFAKSGTGNTKLDVAAGFGGTFTAQGDRVRIRGRAAVVTQESDHRKSGHVEPVGKTASVITVAADSGDVTIAF
ncbi:hypothetical protein HK105_200759 [Polyrhizophydium stewartii]|uniref:DUF4097 domain-containing protein n=1 Tax=Polyrhizophydium stewartii TaxID=2732419 RepID=A0ABR4NK00_9FUNG|nr:hypothetical protein HK105_004315 [Polyrhizophydium stewartii]